jgi:hypothetical protein
VSKLNFLSVYARAHTHAFTKANILAAFSKTRIVPFNPDVVIEKMMAPSLETSISSLLPLTLTSLDQELSQQTPPRMPAVFGPEGTYTPVQRGLNVLALTTASFLVSSSPLASTSRLSALQTIEISSHIHHNGALLSLEPATEREGELMAELRKSQQVITLQKDVMIGMQAQRVLHSLYIEDVRGQLQGKEEKKKKGAQIGRINMDGRAKVLTQDEVFEVVQESQAAHDATKVASLKRKDAKERYSEAMEV